jgi:hypothetical protein
MSLAMCVPLAKRRYTQPVQLLEMQKPNTSAVQSAKKG